MEKYIVKYLYLGEVREKRISQSRLSEFLTYPDIELISVRRLSKHYTHNTDYTHNTHDTHYTQYTDYTHNTHSVYNKHKRNKASNNKGLREKECIK